MKAHPFTVAFLAALILGALAASWRHGEAQADAAEKEIAVAHEVEHVGMQALEICRCGR